MRGFVSGVIWGGILSVLGLAMGSLLMPLPPAARLSDARPPEIAPPAEVAQPAPEPAPAMPSASAPDAPGDMPAETAPAAPEAANVAEAAGPVAAPAPLPAAGSEAPDAPASPTAITTPPALEQAEGRPAVPADPTQPDMAADDSAPATAELPPVPPLTPEEEAALAMPLPSELPATSPLAEPPAMEPAAQDEAPAEPPAEPEPLLDAPKVPQPGLAGEVAGVTTGRLPVISTPEAESAVAEDETATGIEAGGGNSDLPPVQRFATEFNNLEGKPLFAIVLMDTGEADVDRTALAGLPFPISIAIDPGHPAAARHAAIYTAGGKEVLMLATGIPQGATASDLEVTFAAHARALPAAVAVLDLPQGGFQNDRPLASLVVPVIGGQGRGIVTFDRGLNAGDQVARREGVPSARLFRQLDAEGEGLPVIRRYLDRAAFKAAQDGRVVVAGKTTPEMIRAVLEWTVEGRAGSVALAPLTAVLATP